MNITTKSGFKIDINPDKAKDWRFVKALAKAESPNEGTQIIGLTDAVTILLGEDGEQALCRHVEKNGVAVAEDIIREVKEIIDACGEEVKK